MCVSVSDSQRVYMMISFQLRITSISGLEVGLMGSMTKVDKVIYH
jgi:hypothetical protein